MINSPDLTSKLAIDTKSVDDLRLLSKQDSKKALQEAAKQFEALFLNMLVKSMRDATLKSGLIDSQQTQFYTEMYDQQLAQSMSAKGIGLADMMVSQLTRAFDDPNQTLSDPNQLENNPTNAPVSPQAVPATNQAHQLWTDNRAMNTMPDLNEVATTLSRLAADKSYQLWENSAAATEMPLTNALVSENNHDISSITASNLTTSTSNASNHTENFISTLLPHANIASQSTGIPAHFMLAQAALESGWGKYEIRHSDNSPSHNLFGIKAGSSWNGETVETVTTEYINGTPQKIVEKFRAYSSYEEGFRDYANLLANNPRYANVVNTQNAADFANGLQKAGYATDPEYANKLIRILNHSVLSNQEVI